MWAISTISSSAEAEIIVLSKADLLEPEQIAGAALKYYNLYAPVQVCTLSGHPRAPASQRGWIRC